VKGDASGLWSGLRPLASPRAHEEPLSAGVAYRIIREATFDVARIVVASNVRVTM
jgi:hypothetical protein